MATNGFCLLTLTVAAPTAKDGVAVFKKAFKKLRRQVAFKRVFCGGEMHIQIEPAKVGLSAPWNPHGHAICELAVPFTDIDVDALARSWTVLLRAVGSVGTVDIAQRPNLSGAHGQVIE